MVDSADLRFLVNIIGGDGGTELYDVPTITSLLDVFTDVLQGVVPASGGGTTNYLRADGSWENPIASISLSTTTLTGTKAEFNTAVSDGDIVFLDSVDIISGAKTFTSDVKISATKKLYLDGGGDTYIYESSANVLDTYVGGTNILKALTNEVRIGANVSGFTFTGNTEPMLQLVGNDVNRILYYTVYGDNPSIFCQKANGTIGTPTKIVSPNVIGHVSFMGWQETTSTFNHGVILRGTATEDWTSTANGCKFEVYTNANGAVTGAAKFSVLGTGDVGLFQTGNVGAKIFWDGIDGTGNTYTFQSGGDILDTYVGGNRIWTFTTGSSATNRTILIQREDSTPYLQIESHNDSNFSPLIQGVRSRGTIASPTAVQIGDICFRLVGYGYDSSLGANSAQGLFDFTATETWNTGTGRGMYFRVTTTATGSTTNIETMRWQYPNVGMVATGKLYLDGVALTGNTYITESAADVISLFAGGTESMSIKSTGHGVPATSKLYLDGVAQSGNTYIYESAADTMDFFAGGTKTLSLVAAGVRAVGGVVATALGVPTIVAHGSQVAKTAAQATVATFTNGATDGTFEVSANVLVTTATNHNFTVTCAYTDEGNTARTITMTFLLVAGTALTTAIVNANGAVPYHGLPLTIRCKASTAITIATTGTFTTVTYNVRGVIKQLANTA